MKDNQRLTRLAVFFAILISAWAFGPRFTRDQYELPKHAGLLLAAALLLYSSPGIFAPRRWTAHPALAFFVAGTALSAGLSAAPIPSLLGDNESFAGLLTLLVYAALFLAGASRPAGFSRPLSCVILLAGTGSALYAILQQFGASPFPGELFHHATGFAGNPDFLAQQMALTIPFALAPALRRNSLPHWACGTVLFLALGLSASRAGVLSGLTGAILLAWLMRDVLRRRILSVLIGVSVLLACLAGTELALGPGFGLAARITALSAPRSFAQARGDIWETAARSARFKPIIGWGPDGMSAAFSRFAPLHWTAQAGLSTVPRHAHNEILNLTVSGGILGLGLYAWLLACAFRGSLGRASPGIQTASVAVIAFLLHNLFSFGTAATAPVFWLLLGRISREPEARSRPPPAFFLRIAFLAGAALLAAFAAVRLAADAYAFWGKEGSRHGRPELELAGYTSASRLAPWDALYLVNRAYAHEKAGRYAQALGLYRRAVELDPSNGLNWGSAGRAGYALAGASGNAAGMNSAFADMQRSLLLAPSQPALYTAAIQAAHELGHAEEARRLLAVLDKMNPVWAEQLRRRMRGN